MAILSDNPQEQIEAMVLEMMGDPEFMPSPGKSKFDTAKTIAFNRYRQLDNNYQALTLGDSISELDLLKAIDPDDVNFIIEGITKQMGLEALEAKRRGLVPKSGNWLKPGRWMKPQQPQQDTAQQRIYDREMAKLGSLKDGSMLHYKNPEDGSYVKRGNGWHHVDNMGRTNPNPVETKHLVADRHLFE
jgi:hypothetical protein